MTPHSLGTDLFTAGAITTQNLVPAGVATIFQTRLISRPSQRIYSAPIGCTPILLMSVKMFSTSGLASACGTWQAVQK